MDISDFDVILGMDWLMAHRVIIVWIVGGLLPAHGMVFVRLFWGRSMMLYPIT